VVRVNCSVTAREFADEVSISIGIFHQIFTEYLPMRRVREKFVPRLLTDDQKGNRVEISGIVPHPPYSLDLAPANFFLFPKLITTLKRRRFQTIEQIQENAIRERTITENAFQEASQQWKKRWDWCIASGGATLKGAVLTMT
jgi:hypothetical protein